MLNKSIIALLYLIFPVIIYFEYLLVGNTSSPYYSTFNSGDNVGYNLGLGGGLFVSLTFLFSLKKHIKIFRNIGLSKHWFWSHLFFGMIGFFLILAHSKFNWQSLNAGICLLSLTLIVITGIIGRFIMNKATKITLINHFLSYWHFIHIPLSIILILSLIIHLYGVHVY